MTAGHEPPFFRLLAGRRSGKHLKFQPYENENIVCLPRQYLPFSGYALTHRSRQGREEDFDRFDMIVAMDDMNYESLNRLAPSREAARKIFRMAEFCRRHPDRTYVPDPYYEGHEGFELVLDMLEDGCEGILEYLSENGK